jgi:hypothetical protein
MNRKRIEQIESRVLQSPSLSAEDKAALLKDLEALKAEAAAVPEEKLPTAREISAKEASAQSMMEEFTASVEGLEASHPRLTELANRISVVLSNMGI